MPGSTIGGQERTISKRVVGLLVALLALFSPSVAPAGASGLHHLRAHRPRTVTGLSARVLRVGVYRGLAGQYTDLQAAIGAARPGDWILLAPGDYREAHDTTLPGAVGDDRAGAEFAIQTPNLHIRGLDRNRVWLDGTQSGPACSAAGGDQNLGEVDSAGIPRGRNGILVFKQTGVSIENLSVCNFLTGDEGGGNGVWFDGGGATGMQTGMSFRGAYLTATSSYFKDNNSPSAGYGIYSSNTRGGPGLFAHDYADNQNDSAYYVGACPACAVTLDDVKGEYSALGYSGTNSGDVTVENSEFAFNQDGFDTNSQNNDDAPSPQDGTCPGGGRSPNPPPRTQRFTSCWIFTHNYVHDNNNANVPQRGAASAGPVGTGMSISGGRHDIVTANRFVNNGAWGLILVPYPDSETPPAIEHCQGGTSAGTDGTQFCYFDDFGNEIANNSFTHNGFFGNPSNGDIAMISGANPNQSPDSNCFHGNFDTAGALTESPGGLESEDRCGQSYPPAPLASVFGAEVACDSSLLFSCPSSLAANYPRTTQVSLRLPPAQPTMSDPCAGVPSNPWCPLTPAATPPRVR